MFTADELLYLVFCGWIAVHMVRYARWWWSAWQRAQRYHHRRRLRRT